jgi:glyoxylase-like metal-dependent hydrolase (beta-lactamase superfamily II)
MQPRIEAFFDDATSTVSYVVFEQAGSACAIIDSVLDYDFKSGHTKTAAADRIVEFVKTNRLRVEWILETHAHADHLSAAPYLKKQLGGKIAIGNHITQVQGVFKKIFNLEPGFQLDGSQFDYLFDEDELFAIGNLQAQALYVPGHTPADMAYKIGSNVFVGDTLFMPDVGTARCDFPGGNAHTLYQSTRKLLSLPGDTHLYMCHDYPPTERAPRWQTTVAEERAKNIHVHDGIDEQAFVAMRTARDKTLEMPTLILPSIQINIRAGNFPASENNGVSYLKIPLNTL